MDRRVSELLAPYVNQYPGQSYADQFRNASLQRDQVRAYLARPYLVNDDDFILGLSQAEKMLRDQQASAAIGGAMTGLTGAMTVLSDADKSARIRDTTTQEGIISDLSRAGNYNYNNYDQLANDYAQTSFNPQFGYQDIRGMTTGQKVGSVATSALSGAATGLQIGGLWGGLIGLIGGGAIGGAGVVAGDTSAQVKQNQLNLQANLASEAAQQNFAAAHERIGDNIHRQNAVNAVARGGKIQRQTLKEYADSVLSSGPKMREHNTRHYDIKKSMTEGGLSVRIKIK